MKSADQPDALARQAPTLDIGKVLIKAVTDLAALAAPPPGILDLRFNDPQIGLTDAQMIDLYGHLKTAIGWVGISDLIDKNFGENPSANTKIGDVAAKIQSWIAAETDGSAEVAMATAAVTSKTAEWVSERMNLSFGSSQIGLKNKIQVRAFKNKLAVLLPDHAKAIAKLPDQPNLKPADVAQLVGRLKTTAYLADTPMTGVPAVRVKPQSEENRKKVADACGGDFAAKASDRMVQMLSLRMAGAPTQTATSQAQSTVVECHDAPPVQPGEAPVQPAARQSQAINQ